MKSLRNNKSLMKKRGKLDHYVAISTVIALIEIGYEHGL
ncbi:TMhelix containing protein [Vibrio phage 1.161.O._10N.261.48.C5]|nr:TMhelix containing protein [Vibrio phage 1.161.O._10N.261.48.C5]